MKRVVVIGGAGFIGSHIVDELIKKKYAVRVLDNLTRGKYDRISKYVDEGRAEFIKGDIRKREDVEKSMQDVDYVFHEAADCINRSTKFPQESIDINMSGSINVFESALKNDVKKLIFASSASVYGNPKKLPMNENDELNPITPYCISKLACERLLKFYSGQGLKYNILRYFNVYGPRQNTDAYYTSVIALFVKRILSKQSPLIKGDGQQSMDFVHVKDVVQANVLALESDVFNEIFNVGTGRSTTIKQLAQILIKSLGADVKPEFSGEKSIVQQRRADISKAKQLMGFKPVVDVENGLREIVEEIKEHQEDY